MPNSFHHHFRKHDPPLHGVIKQIGPYRLKPNRDRFGMLVRSIISQQISVGAARSIRARLEALVGQRGMKPEVLAALSIPELRSAGLSPQKASYMHDLAAKVADGTVCLAKIGRLGDEEVIAQLVHVKGIGRWTAQMFLIFALGRDDVFPVDDLGVRAAIAKIYGYDEPPPKPDLLEIGQRWSPFASVGSWYCWRYLEMVRTNKNNGKAP
jgi:DNA-3-methyladenine glycosylase II